MLSKNLKVKNLNTLQSMSDDEKKIKFLLSVEANHFIDPDVMNILEKKLSDFTDIKLLSYEKEPPKVKVEKVPAVKPVKIVAYSRTINKIDMPSSFTPNLPTYGGSTETPNNTPKVKSKKVKPLVEEEEPKPIPNKIVFH